MPTFQPHFPGPMTFRERVARVTVTGDAMAESVPHDFTSVDFIFYIGGYPAFVQKRWVGNVTLVH